ncbi:hypothetical protein Sps_04659 [Shewanella psychrophila]|uniref:Uncharacterized protein n=1 Tax=Shewanella psychrophila TaxID=225848 RepID=A0A1S6HWD6_9GAMM|nr:hypothetical protein [Shewanella psychrophila]AQS39744.1 hypothetical protein Sps_04659 [Shewanella psychrophila]
MKNFFYLFLVLVASCHVQANPLSDNFRQYILTSELASYHSSLTAEESDELIVTQLQVATECLISEGNCEHVLYSLRITSQIQVRQTDSQLHQQKLLYLQDSYTELEQGQSPIYALSIPVEFVQSRIDVMRQRLLREVLARNTQATPIDFVGSYQMLRQSVQKSDPSVLYLEDFDESLDLDNPITHAYMSLLDSVLVNHSEKSPFGTQMSGLMSYEFKSLVNREFRPQRCVQCTTTIIVEYYSDTTTEKRYEEVDVIDFMARRMPRIAGWEKHRIAFPYYYLKDVVPLLLSYKVFFHENAAHFDLYNGDLDTLNYEEIQLVSNDIKNKIEKMGLAVNFASIMEMTFRWLTATGQVESLASSGIALNGLRSNQFNAGSHNKIFAASIFANVVLAKIPRVLEGEVMRYGCGLEQWSLPPILYILLEDKCVFTPSFNSGSLSITASTTFDVQDQYGYNISVYHKPTNSTLLTRTISNKEQITINRVALGAFNLNDMVLYIDNTNPAVKSAVAAIQVTSKLFEYDYGGVVKNNSFYFVQRLPYPEFNKFRGEEFGCTLVDRSESQQINCLERKLNSYNNLPGYFYKNMEPVAFLNPYMPISLDQILIQQEAERIVREREEAEKIERARQKSERTGRRVCTNPMGIC